uniref:Uncharacterized protein n=1 Tax=Eutreptiella gymnastica TaxID=73025 RepID=A0A7S4FSI1_9EUGL
MPPALHLAKFSAVLFDHRVSFAYVEMCLWLKLSYRAPLNCSRIAKLLIPHHLRQTTLIFETFDLHFSYSCTMCRPLCGVSEGVRKGEKTCAKQDVPNQPSKAMSTCPALGAIDAPGGKGWHLSM